MMCSFIRVLFVTPFAGHKVDKALDVVVQTMVKLKGVSTHSAAKYGSTSYIIANFISSFTIF